ncbi:MAG TPA: hypothetical protein VEY87_09765 [Gaiellaceae bacterium]|nr:hypothetical protein [Gaiellaceae bacterium]
MRRIVPFLNFLPVLAILGLFVLFTFETANPLQRVEKGVLVAGRVLPDHELQRLGPLQHYVALYRGTGSKRPLFPVDDALAEPDGSFALRADDTDGERFFVFVRVETADFSTFCATRPIPPVRLEPDERWVVAATGKGVPRLRVAVDTAARCTG